MFSIRLRELREAAGLSQTELAEKLNLKRAALSNYEKDQREPNLETLIRLADYFNVSLDELVGRDLDDDYFLLLSAAKMGLPAEITPFDRKIDQYLLVNVLRGDDNLQAIIMKTLNRIICMSVLLKDKYYSGIELLSFIQESAIFFINYYGEIEMVRNDHAMTENQKKSEIGRLQLKADRLADRFKQILEAKR